MDKIQTALDKINNALKTIDEVRLILEEELPRLTIITEHGDDFNVEHSDAYYDYKRNDPDAENPFTEPKDIERAEKVVKVNTYRIEELCTTGWVLLGKEYSNLRKEDASQTIQNLIDTESYNPNDLRVVVDGQL